MANQPLHRTLDAGAVNGQHQGDFVPAGESLVVKEKGRLSLFYEVPHFFLFALPLTVVLLITLEIYYLLKLSHVTGRILIQPCWNSFRRSLRPFTLSGWEDDEIEN